ncbi:MAG TPA: DNA-3-methyladenine glycosylase, partial [bacterium]|nr:DNA-3-methyladenine glycosylase [bacterium]
MQTLCSSFYQRNTKQVAKDLLGKILIRKYKGKEYRARIVETEAYL